MSKKSMQRLESKKRKAEAFLNLVQNDTDYINSKKRKTEKNTEDPSTDVKVMKENESGLGCHVGSSDGVPDKSDVMLAEYKKILKERQKASMQRPKLFLTLDELTRDYPTHEESDEVKKAPPLFITDTQNLLLYALQGNYASVKLRWCRLLRVPKITKVVTVVLESVSKEEFEEFGDSLSTLKSAFDMHVEMISPIQYGSSVREDLMNVGLSVLKITKMGGRQMSNAQMNIKNGAITTRSLLGNPLESAKLLMKGKQDESQEIESDNSDKQQGNKSCDVTTHSLDMIDRTCLVLSTSQMIYESIPVPVKSDIYKDFVFTKDKYSSVSERSPLFAIDCEMIQTKASKMDLARVSIVNENLEPVYDTYVKPWAPITDYVTRFSGITQEIMKRTRTRIQDVQQYIRRSLPADAILCGQSIGSDLRSLKMFHPYLIDTSVIYNMTGNREVKTGLRKLAALFLDRTIQASKQGHSSVEDAQATMELVLLKLRKGVEFGDKQMANADLIMKPSDVALKETSSASDEAKDCDKCDSCQSNVNTQSSHSGSQTLRGKSETGLQQYTCKDEDSVDKSTKTVVNSKLDSELIRQRRLFFHSNGSKFIANFILHVKKQNKIGKVIDESNAKSLYPPVMNEYFQQVETDREREKATVAALQEVDFCFTHLYGYRDFLAKHSESVEEEEKKKCLWKLDRRFWKILTQLPANSLFVVVLPGKETGGVIHPAMTFAKIVC